MTTFGIRSRCAKARCLASGAYTYEFSEGLTDAHVCSLIPAAEHPLRFPHILAITLAGNLVYKARLSAWSWQIGRSVRLQHWSENSLLRHLWEFGRAHKSPKLEAHCTSPVTVKDSLTEGISRTMFSLECFMLVQKAGRKRRLSYPFSLATVSASLLSSLLLLVLTAAASISNKTLVLTEWADNRFCKVSFTNSFPAYFSSKRWRSWKMVKCHFSPASPLSDKSFACAV